MKKIFSIILLVFCFIACQKGNEGKVFSELEIKFSSQDISVPMDAVTPVEFTVSGIDGAAVKVEVEWESENEDEGWNIESTIDSKTGEALLYVGAPDKLSSTVVLVKVIDVANVREASAYISLSSVAAVTDPIELVFSDEACELDAGESVEVGFRVSGLGNAQLVTPKAEDLTLGDGLELTSITYDPSGATGTVTVSAPESSAGGELKVSMTVKDNFNRTASAEFTVTVVAIPEEDEPEDPEDSDDPVTPGSSIVPPDKSYNCYLVKPGSYARFTKKLPGIVKMELAWQDAPNLINNISVSPVDGYVTVLTNNVAGNALVLGKDASGKTLWSWHIWSVDFDPEQTAVEVDGVTFMDRNLGAISAAKGDVGAMGNTYQWGRKDPLPRATTYVTGYAESNIYDIEGNPITPYNTTNGSGGSYYKFRDEAASDAVVTVDEVIANPEYFFCRNEHNVAWWLGISPDVPKDYWGGVSFSKGEYDPCPEGWKVPVVSSEGKHPYEFVTGDKAVVDDANKGMKYTDGDKELWFPYSGERTRSEGLIARTARGGNYWTGTFEKIYETKGQEHELYKYMQFKAAGNKYITGYKRQAYVATGLAVRCVKE